MSTGTSGSRSRARTWEGLVSSGSQGVSVQRSEKICFRSEHTAAWSSPRQWQASLINCGMPRQGQTPQHRTTLSHANQAKKKGSTIPDLISPSLLTLSKPRGEMEPREVG